MGVTKTSCVEKVAANVFWSYEVTATPGKQHIIVVQNQCTRPRSHGQAPLSSVISLFDWCRVPILWTPAVHTICEEIRMG